jgi:hypothetical protein
MKIETQTNNMNELIENVLQWSIHKNIIGMNAVAKWQQAVSTKKFSPIHDGVLELEPPAWA